MNEPVTPQPPYVDAEVQALALCVRIMTELDHITRQRLLAYLADRFPRAERAETDRNSDLRNSDLQTYHAECERLRAEVARLATEMAKAEEP